MRSNQHSHSCDPFPMQQDLSGKHVFRERGLRAKRSFGQCFLADANIARRIAKLAVRAPGCTALEIGAGSGALTRELLACGANVVAIERDRDLVPVLQISFHEAIEQGRLHIHEADAATCDWQELLANHPLPHVLVGNIPYQITGRLLHRATEACAEMQRVVFMVQKEVADRIAALPGSKNYGAMSIFVQHCFRICERIVVPPTCFRPQPSVYSTIVSLEPHAPLPEPIDHVMQVLVTKAFSRRRKTLRNAWRDAFCVTEQEWQRIARDCQVCLDARPEQLSPAHFAAICAKLRDLQVDANRDD